MDEMKRQKKHIKYLLAAGLVLLLWSCAAFADQAAMDMLPSSEPLRCIVCHEDVAPVSADDLNPFGVDFKASLDLGLGWTEELARGDSDDDGCTNGIELGDEDGDGQLDEGVSAQASNPGVTGDCTSASFDQKTWSELKKLFDN